jgi:KUP system potassium uptake protein
VPEVPEPGGNGPDGSGPDGSGPGEGEARGSEASDPAPGGAGGGPPPASARHARRAKTGIAALSLGALGVVFGDIGTSPLYSLQTVFNADHRAVHATSGDVYGVISLVFWSITMIVSVKYVSFIMRAATAARAGSWRSRRSSRMRRSRATPRR